MKSGGQRSHLLLSLAAAHFVFVLRRAWVTEDAFITFRVVDNFVNGLGLTWNPAERVQAYTHPLWTFALTAVYWFTRDPYWTTVVLSCAASAGTLWVLARMAPEPWIAALAILALTLSNAWLDYSTSGLENPLTHLLLACFCTEWLAPAPRAHRLLLWTSLSWVNRPDSALLCVPALAVRLWRDRRELPWRDLAGAASPAVAWTLFSIVYYGFPFPNTAYAKLSTGIPTLTLARQGIGYIQSAAESDPVMAALVVVALAAAIIARRSRELALAAGVALSLVYVVRVGGDFMRGRFLTAALLLSVVVLVRLAPRTPPVAFRIAPAAALAALATSPLLPAYSAGHEKLPTHDRFEIADERYFWRGIAPVGYTAGAIFPSYPWRFGGEDIGRERNTAGVQNIGLYGYYAGPLAHVVDHLALSEPLLARIPSIIGRVYPGHYMRWSPPGYGETLHLGRNLIADPSVRAYYDLLGPVVRGPLFTRQRAAAIWALNTGQADHLLLPAHPDPVRVRLDEASASLIDARGGGVRIQLPRRTHARRIEFTSDSEGFVRVELFRDGRRLDGVTLVTHEGRRTHRVALPALACWLGYDEVGAFNPFSPSKFGELRLVD